MATSVSVGDKVTTSATHDVNGTSLASFVRETTYDVIQVGGKGLPDSRIVIGIGSAVTAAVDVSTLTVISSTAAKSTDTKDSGTVTYKEDAMTSKGIEEGLTNLLKNSIPKEMMKYTMRLFGLPCQYTQYCDYRTFSTSSKAKSLLVGRKFIENIMMEAPVVTIVPGKPSYLPAAKNKRGLSYELLSHVNRDTSSLFTALKDEKNLHEKLRYYDFEQDYYSYMRYVNILCAVAASFLDLGEMQLDGVPLTRYDWKNYRWTADKYSTAAGNIALATKNAISNAVDTLKTYGASALNAILGTNFKTTQSTVTAFEDKEDKSLMESLESLMTQVNFVQFYVDASSGSSESADNTTATSKMEGIFDTGSEVMKEIAFLANSGGLDSMDEFLATADAGADVMNDKLFGDSTSNMGGILSRLMSNATNIIKGDNFVFPEIYQSSRFTRNYSITVDLRAPYGNKLSYYMNILVPLFHLLALAIPKQSTANTYSSPFLIKAYYPGVFTCNLGIVQQIQIDRNSSGDSWTVDGFPNDIKVTLSIVDLYSDLSMTPSGDVVLFLSNSSLIEYIATSCGVNLTVPQLQNRVKYMTTIIKQSFDTIVDDTINMAVLGNLESLIASIAGV